MGPRSRDLLSRLTRDDLADFPFGSSREISLGYATVRATRITYVGELGWELYVPAEFAASVYDDLLDAGADLGVRQGGYYAIDSLRLEKGYRAFPRDLNPDLNPVEAGLLFACKLGTDLDFLGRAAVEKARASGARRRLAGFAVEDPDAMLWGGELVLRDGRPAGLVTSAAWGATVGAAVGLVLLWDPEGAVVDPAWVRAGSYQVNVGGTVVPLRVSLRPLVDPEGERIKR
jgi:4-methylaminobutanoate oxidase (formaldehyde-forming)